jgi:D-alanyl-lipoteichoic acid acyltransferase DltB (MBOAT superfamily)
LSIIPLLILTLAGLLIGWAIPARWRAGLILLISLLAIYWLQPALPIRSLDFWLPTISIGLTVFVWLITRQATPGGSNRRANLVIGLVIAGIFLAIGASRYFESFCCLTPNRPPPFPQVMIFLLIGGLLALLPILLPRMRAFLVVILVGVILGLFIILKSPWLAHATSGVLRGLTGQPVELASAQDIIWFGFSFLAFRLLHVLFDFRSGRLPPLELGEFVSYALFFPALPAGPIDRVQRFTGDFRQLGQNPSQNRAEGLRRIILGIFKKFVVADTLALIALNSQNSTQVTSTIWMWVLLYTYALRIYFDFAGYTDVAIGIGKLVGINLPENFDKPYLKHNLTAFWNSWHITLAQWFRAYYFNPVTRNLRQRAAIFPTWAIIFFSQVSTMFLIGIWHGITWNYAIWGLWHGVGLFIHNRWVDWLRPRGGIFKDRPRLQRLAGFTGWFLTFNYVSLGWVWFALPTWNQSIQVFARLFGI